MARNEYNLSMKMWPLLTVFCVLATTAAVADMPSSPKMIQLATGTRVATWTLAAERPQHRTPILFLHGGPGGFINSGAIEKGSVLRSAGFTTIYFDQAGSGQSDRPPAKDYTLQRAVDDVEALRVALNVDKLILWGSSYGAALAVLYERRFPDHVAGLIFTSPGGFPGTKTKLDYRATDDRNIGLGKALGNAVRLIDQKGADAEATLPQGVAGELFDTQLNAEMLGGRMVCKGASVPQAGSVTGGNLYANRMLGRELKSLKLSVASVPARPTITIRGSCDFVPLANAQKYQSTYGGNLVTIDKSGHGLRENAVDLDNAFRQFATGPLARVE